MAILPSSRDTHHTNGPDLNPCLNFIPCQFQSFTISLPCSTQPHAKHTTMLQHQHKLHFSAIHPHHHLDSVNFLFLLPCQCLQILKKCFSPQVSSYGLIMFFFFFFFFLFFFLKLLDSNTSPQSTKSSTVSSIQGSPQGSSSSSSPSYYSQEPSPTGHEFCWESNYDTMKMLEKMKLDESDSSEYHPGYVNQRLETSNVGFYSLLQEQIRAIQVR